MNNSSDDKDRVAFKHFGSLAGQANEADWIALAVALDAKLARSSCPPAWIKVSERLPERANNVLAYFVNEFGHGRRIRAFYARQHQIEDTSDNGLEGAEEKDGTYYVSAGWYESNENDEYYYRVSCEVSHWMPLPDAPVPECATPNESSPSEIPNNSFDTPAAPTEAPEWAKRANDYADEGFAFLRDKPTEAPALSREIRLCQDGKPCKKPGECEARGKCAVFYGTPMEALSSLQPPVQGSAELVRKLNSSAAVISNLPEQPGYNGSLLTIDDVESSTIAKHLSEAATALSRQPSQQGPSEEEVFEAKKWKGDRWGAGVCARAILRWAEQSGRKT